MHSPLQTNHISEVELCLQEQGIRLPGGHFVAVEVFQSVDGVGIPHLLSNGPTNGTNVHVDQDHHRK